jgi:Zn-dependent hydrolases, including glyoxylases
MGNEVPEWNTEMKEISPGIYAYVQATGGWFINNAGLIVGKKDAIVVDSLANAKRAESFLGEIKRVTDKPFSYLINTHHHTDHTWTNHLFQAKTICHTRCREETT